MKRLLITLSCCFFTVITFAQTTKDLADADFKKKNYAEAIKLYKRALKEKSNDETKSKINFQLGECYRLTNDFIQAKDFYSKALEQGYRDPIINLHLGDMYLKAGDYNKASAFYQKYQSLNPSDTKIKQKIESCSFAIDNLKKAPAYSIRNEESLNSPDVEYGAAFLPNVALLYKNRKEYDAQFDLNTALAYSNRIYWAEIAKELKERIVFSSTRCAGSQQVDMTTNQCFSDIFESLYDKRTSKWSTPVRLKGGINSKYNEGFFSYSEATKLAYYMQCVDPEGGVKESKEQICNIYTSLYNDTKNTWSDPEVVNFNMPKYDFGHPSITEDGQTLYFASNMPGGYGGWDIWKINKEGDKWGKPINLGPNVNTDELEAYPFIMGDSVLYFTSTGHSNMGGRDIFRSEIDAKGNYGKAVNLGYPINSSADDFGIIVHPSNKYGYFQSDRGGNDDIYKFRRLRPTKTIRGNVKDNDIEKNLKGVKVICRGTDFSNRATFTDDEGNYEFTGLDPDVEYWVFVKKENMLTEVIQTPPAKMRDTATTPEIDTLAAKPKDTTSLKTPPVIDVYKPKVDTLNITVKTYDPKGENEIKNIYWDFDRADLRPASKVELDKLSRFLISDKERYIIINSYTDERGTDEYNLELSQRRAQSVVDYLIHKGIPNNRISAIGRGKTNLVKKRAKTEEDHQLNRRTTFKIVSRSEFATYSKSPNIFVEKDVDTTKYAPVIKDPTVTTSFVPGLEFRVQFIATKNPLNPEYYAKLKAAFPQHKITYTFEADELHRHFIGSFSDLKSAQKFMKEVKAVGYEAFVVAFNNGVKISIPEAKALMKK